MSTGDVLADEAHRRMDQHEKKCRKRYKTIDRRLAAIEGMAQRAQLVLLGILGTIVLSGLGYVALRVVDGAHQ